MVAARGFDEALVWTTATAEPLLLDFLTQRQKYVLWLIPIEHDLNKEQKYLSPGMFGQLLCEAYFKAGITPSLMSPRCNGN